MKPATGQGTVFWQCRSAQNDATIIVGLTIRGRIVGAGGVTLDNASVWLPACYVVEDDCSTGRPISIAEALALVDSASVNKVLNAARRLAVEVERSIAAAACQTVNEPWYQHYASILRKQLDEIRIERASDIRGVA